MTTDWNPVLRGEFAKAYWDELQSFVAEERRQHPVFPPRPDVFRAFFRSFNMLDDPNALLADPQVLTAAATAHATKADRPPEPELGPPRDELLAGISIASAAGG